MDRRCAGRIPGSIPGPRASRGGILCNSFIRAETPPARPATPGRLYAGHGWQPRLSGQRLGGFDPRRLRQQHFAPRYGVFVQRGKSEYILVQAVTGCSVR